MPRGLISSGDIIAGSWENLKRHPRMYAGFVVWFTALSLVQWIMLIFSRMLIAEPIFRTVTYTLLMLPVSLVFAIVGLAIIDVTARTLRNKPADPRESLSVGVHRLIPLIWVSFLSGVLIFFGFILLVLPAIYLIVALNFAVNFLVVDGVRGTGALKASKDLVSGRWWSAMWRIAVPGLFFYLASAFALALLYLVIGAFMGDPGLFFGAITSIDEISGVHLLVTTVIPQVVNGFTLPLFIGADLILWYDLKRT